MKELVMKYKKPAEDSTYGWENESLPIGNGYMGINIFGTVKRERLQITHNALVNPQYDSENRMFGGLNNLAELYVHFPHDNISEYERGLRLNNAISYCRYNCGGILYEREYFASYPDKVFVMKFTSSQKSSLNFDFNPEIPFIKDFALEEGDGGGKSGQIHVSNDTVTLSGTLEFYNLRYEGQAKIISDGQIFPSNSGISVKNATSAVIIFGVDTNYELCEKTFSEDDPIKKIPNADPHDKVCTIINNALKYTYDELKQHNTEDYTSLFGRVNLSLCDETADYVDVMMEKYQNGEDVPYLEELYFQYGRYLLISSSRKGCLPANLQGIWNCHEFSPWGSGYWHNINVQMNYWPAFNTNLLETFDSYIDFYKAYKPKSEEYASEYIKEHNPENYTDIKGECGWTIGTAAYPYFITAPGGHSGPGTGALTSKLFWEAYDFSRDENILSDVTYPALLGMSKFLTKTVKNYNGEYLVSYSASPEQLNNGIFVHGGSYHQTVGCAFDQQMIYENGKDFLKTAELLGIENDAVNIQEVQLEKYSPIEIGWSGQIKEFQEENFYGEIGEYCHRHISHLMALYPGTLINKTTPAWLDAAKFSLTERGIRSTGWALAHRLNAWARTGEGDKAYEVLRKLLSEKTMLNLWDLHPPFQIDGNFGATSGIAEMLLQSHDGYIEILPCLPNAWKNGEYSGLLARGNFEVSVKWANGTAQKIKVKAMKNNNFKLRYANISKATGSEYEIISRDIISVNAQQGCEYVFENIPAYESLSEPSGLMISKNLELSWFSDLPVNVYRAVNSQSSYTLIAEGIENGRFTDTVDFSEYETITYKIRCTKNGAESKGIYKTINHASQKQIDRYNNYIKALNNK